MATVSFVVDGDGPDRETIAFVAKDKHGARQCVVLNCMENANELLLTISQALQLRAETTECDEPA